MPLFSQLFENIFNPLFWVQPLFYSFHGWLATEMALWMLFHPYEPQYIPGTKIQIPFTPGIFPRGRRKLSVSIANTITDILLTQEDIKRQAEKLITEENLYKTLDVLFDSVGNELRDITHIRRIYRYVDTFLPQFINKLLDDYIISLQHGREKQFEALVSQLISKALPHLKINESQATLISQTLFNRFLTPEAIRVTLIKILTEENIAILDEAIRSRIGGLQGFIMQFIDLKKGFYQLKSYLEDEPEGAQDLITQMITRLKLEEKLANGLLKFSPEQLPKETLDEIKHYISDTGINLLTTHREEITSWASHLSQEGAHAMTTSLIHLDFNQVSEDWLPGFKRDLASFAYTYLNKELENMLSRALPAISLNTVIVEKIDQFSAKELEETIQSICHRELRWLAALGAFLGFWLGLLSNAFSFWWHPGK